MPAMTFAKELNRLLKSDFESQEEHDIAFYILSRSEIDLKDIMKMYQKLYSASIRDDVDRIAIPYGKKTQNRYFVELLVSCFGEINI